ncbi:MAG: DUF285 domain-containing protein [Bacteroidales bacterium]|nr:DUF285 domain-containing protein [Bacteroidales bacterium]
MKKFNFMPFIMAILLTSMSIFITSCDKDDDENTPSKTTQKSSPLIESKSFQNKLEGKYSKSVFEIKYIKFENHTKEAESDRFTTRLSSEDSETPIFSIISDDTLKICTPTDSIILPEKCDYLFSKFEKVEEILNTKILNISKVTSLEGMFSTCKSLTKIEDIETWNVENVEYFSGMFYACTKLQNINIENWKVSNKAKKFDYMFSQCGVEKLNLEKWNTESVETMENMFYISKIKTFSGKGWNTLKCNNFTNIFDKTTIEELDLTNWKINDNEETQESAKSMISGSQSIHITCSKEIQSIIKVYLAGATWTLVD